MSDKEFEYRIEYGDAFEKQISDGNANPLLGFKIIAGQRDLTGTPIGSNEYYLDDYMTYHLEKLLTAIPDISEGKRKELDFFNQPKVLIIEPQDEIVEISLVSKYDFEHGGDVEYTSVPREVFVNELRETAEAFYERIVDINSDLGNEPELRKFREALSSVSGYV